MCKENALRFSIMELSFSFIVTALFIASLSAISAAASPVSRVDVIAPASALLNNNVLIRIVDGNNNAIAGATVLIASPSKESIIMLTDSNGEAEFNATYEGLYTYSVPGFYITAIRTTNVVMPAESAPTSVPSPAVQQEVQQAPPSAAMALASYAPWALGLIVLFLIVFFLVTHNKKKSKKK